MPCELEHHTLGHPRFLRPLCSTQLCCYCVRTAVPTPALPHQINRQPTRASTVLSPWQGSISSHYSSPNPAQTQTRVAARSTQKQYTPPSGPSSTFADPSNTILQHRIMKPQHTHEANSTPGNKPHIIQKTIIVRLLVLSRPQTYCLCQLLAHIHIFSHS